MGQRSNGLRGRRRFRPWIEGLECRWAPHAGHGTLLPAFSSAPPPISPTITPNSTLFPPGILSTSEFPPLHSNAGASKTLYLDFDGHFEPVWGAFTDIDIPAYDSDGDPTIFGDLEVINIMEIWRRVAEDFAPFDIDVTTEAPDNFDDTAHLRVAIGGDGAWTDGANAGISYINLFADAIPNVVFVFPDNLGMGNAKLVAEGISHESGHAFGLKHQSLYDDDGNLLDEYHAGDLTRAPIMGDSYAAQRGVWWHGPSEESMSELQDDMALLAAALGWRADDVGDTPDDAVALTVHGATVSGAGIIGAMDDLDVWSFDTDEGAIMFQVTVPFGVNNLDAKAQLLDAGGEVVVAWQDPETTYDVTLVATVAAGSYRLVVGSHGAYGDVGQYAITGLIVPVGSVVTPPTDLSVEILSPTEIDLTWQDNADDETGYIVEWSLDGAAWSTLAELDPDTVEFTVAGLTPATTYHYQVYAVSDLATSGYSNPAEALMPPAIPATPTGLAATAVAFDKIALVWTDEADNETGYAVARSLDGSSWVVAILPPESRAYHDEGLSESTAYVYRVFALNGESTSGASNLASAETMPATPNAPNGLTVTSTTASQAQLAWADNADNESGYVVERSLPDSAWTTLATLAANATTYVDTTLQPATAYLYRVHAINDGVVSDESAVVRAVTLPLPPAPPTLLRPLAHRTAFVNLVWNDASDNETYFKVLRSRDGVHWLPVGYAAANAGSFKVMKPPRGQTHYFAVVAVNAGGESTPSNVIAVRYDTVLARAAVASYSWRRDFRR